MSLNIGPLADAGAEVTGLDVSRPIPADIQAELYAAWLRHGVLVFRDIAHSDE